MAGLSIPQSEYRAHPAISKSDLFKITKSPLHFKWSMENKEDKTAALIFGSACHKYILERDDFDSEFAVALNVDRRTKSGKEEYAKWLEENEGKDVVSSDDMEKIKAMAEVIDSNKFAKRLLSGEHEKSFFWTDEKSASADRMILPLLEISTSLLTIKPRTTQKQKLSEQRLSNMDMICKPECTARGTKRTLVKMQYSFSWHRKRNRRMRSTFFKLMNT